MAARTTGSRPSSPASTDRRGFSLVELLVAVVVMGIILGLVLPIVMSNRRVVRLDQVRTASNQTLRAASDLLGADVRIAGERFGLGLGMSPIELRVDGNGNADLVLRRNLHDALPVCEPLDGSQSAIKVAEWGAHEDHGGGGGPDVDLAPAQCAVHRTVRDDRGVAWPATLYEHKQQVEAAGGVLNAVIYDPINGVGQWFPMTIKPRQGSGGSERRPDHVFCAADVGPGSCAWNRQAEYGPGDGTGLYSFIVILEESTYRVRDGVLEKVDGASDEVLRIADGFERFDVTLTLDDGSTVSTWDGDDDWLRIRSVDVDMAVTLSEGRKELTRTIQASYFPRNLLSR